MRYHGFQTAGLFYSQFLFVKTDFSMMDIQNRSNSHADIKIFVSLLLFYESNTIE